MLAGLRCGARVMRSAPRAALPAQRYFSAGRGGSSHAVGAGLAAMGCVGAAAFFLDAAQAHEEAPAALSQGEWRKFKLVAEKRLSPDTKLLRFALPSAEHTLGLTVASCLSFQAEIDGETVGRPYTPISTADQKGYADFVIKAYPQGKMSKHVNSLKVGQSIQMKGPWKKIDYKANQWNSVAMLAGGTGVTPMLQIIHTILLNPADDTKVTLVFGNRSVDDILLRDRLDAMAELYPQFDVVYVLDNAPSEWAGESGYMTADMLSKYLPEPDSGSKVLVCGPPPMYKALCGPKDKRKQGPLLGVLKEMGYDEGGVFKF